MEPESIAGPKPEPDAGLGAFAADQVAAEEPPILSEAFLGGLGGVSQCRG